MDPVQNAQCLEIFKPFIIQAKKDIIGYKKKKHAPTRIHLPPFIIQCEEQRQTVLAALCALSTFESGGSLRTLHPKISKEVKQFIDNVVHRYECGNKLADSGVRAKAYFVHKSLQVLEVGPLEMNEIYDDYKTKMPELFGIIELHQ